MVYKKKYVWNYLTPKHLQCKVKWQIRNCFTNDLTPIDKIKFKIKNKF